MNPSVRILYNHVIADRPPLLFSHGISPRRFERQIVCLKRLGYRFVALSQALSQPQPKTICLSLDDGFACNFASLLPLMAKYKLRPTLFLLGMCIDNKALAWNHKLHILRNSVPRHILNQHLSQLMAGADLDNLFQVIPMSAKDRITDELWASCMSYGQEEFLRREKPFLSVSQLRTLVDKGAELALHSASHPDFTRLSLQEATLELQQNIAVFEQLDLPYHRLFAYPYGRVMSANEDAGLLAATALQATFGIRYTTRDNQTPNTLWQRQNMESSPAANFIEFALKPLARSLLARKP